MKAKTNKKKITQDRITNQSKQSTSKKSSDDKMRIIIYLLILLFAYIPTYNHIFDKKLAFLGDNANYYVFGKAIADGKGYINSHVVEQTKVNSFPPGYSFLIANTIKVFNDKITTIKITNGVLYFLSLIILFFFFRQISKNINLSFVLTLVMLFNFYLLQYSTWMMSEIPFIFFTSLSLLALSKIKTEKAPWLDYWFFIMLFAMAYSYHIRSQGIALFAGVFGYYLVQKNWKHLAATFAGFIALLLPWYIRNSSLPGSPYEKALTYKNYYDTSKGKMDGLGDWMDRFVENFSRYITSEIPSSIFGTEPNYESGSWLAGFLILAIVGFGIFRTKKYQIAIAAYILATFGILMIWPPVWTGVRFMLPIVPLLIFFFFYGIYEIIIVLLSKAKIDTVKVAKILPFFFLVFIFVFYPKLDKLNKEAKTPINPLYKNYFALAKWTKNNLPKDAIILCRKPMLFHLYSEHFVNGIVKIDNPEEALEKMKERKYTHIVIYGDGLSQRYFVPLYQKYPKKFPVIQKLSNPDVYLMEINP